MRTSETSPYNRKPFREAAGREFRPGGLELTEEAARECDLQPGERVLDLACGVGATAEYLAAHWGAHAVGLDRSAQFLREASARSRAVAWVRGEADRLPFADGVFDAVFCECFLTMVPDPGAVLREARRVLRPGGRFVVTDVYLRTPDASCSLEHLPPQTCLAGARGRETVLADVEATGFRVRLWRDRSDALKLLTARLILACDSVEEFWSGVLGASDGRPEAVPRSHPGYYLMVADRADRSRGL